MKFFSAKKQLYCQYPSDQFRRSLAAARGEGTRFYSSRTRCSFSGQTVLLGGPQVAEQAAVFENQEEKISDDAIARSGAYSLACAVAADDEAALTSVDRFFAGTFGICFLLRCA